MTGGKILVMTTIIKVCKIHGDLTQEQVYLKRSLKTGKNKGTQCKLCVKEIKKQHWENNKEIIKPKANKQRKEKYNSCPEFKIKLKEINKRYYEKKIKSDPLFFVKKREAHKRNNPDKKRVAVIVSKHKITQDQYFSLTKHHNGLCAICKNPQTQKSRSGNDIVSLSVDHCHKTGEIRGMLCQKCNTGLGMFRDNVDFLKKAIDYLLSINERKKIWYK